MKRCLLHATRGLTFVLVVSRDRSPKAHKGKVSSDELSLHQPQFTSLQIPWHVSDKYLVWCGSWIGRAGRAGKEVIPVYMSINIVCSTWSYRLTETHTIRGQLLICWYQVLSLSSPSSTVKTATHTECAFVYIRLHVWIRGRRVLYRQK